MNLGKKPIKHFFNELGQKRAERWLDDYPYLKEAWNANDGRYALINLDDIGSGELDIIDSLDPDGITIWDYLHLGTDEKWFLQQADTLRRAAQQLETGFLLVCMQKAEGRKLPYGADTSKFQSDIMVTLFVEKEHESYTECRLDIEKSKDYEGKTNPKSRCIYYYTGGLHGKLIAHSSGWVRKPTKEAKM